MYILSNDQLAQTLPFDVSEYLDGVIAAVTDHRTIIDVLTNNGFSYDKVKNVDAVQCQANLENYVDSNETSIPYVSMILLHEYSGSPENKAVLGHELVHAINQLASPYLSENSTISHYGAEPIKRAIINDLEQTGETLLSKVCLEENGQTNGYNDIKDLWDETMAQTFGEEKDIFELVLLLVEFNENYYIDGIEKETLTNYANVCLSARSRIDELRGEGISQEELFKMSLLGPEHLLEKYGEPESPPEIG